MGRSLALFGVAAGLCLAQREAPNLSQQDQQTSVLWRISWESDRAKKLAQYEQFLVDFPKDQYVGWVYDQIYGMLLDNNENTRALAVSEKILAIDPDDVELAYKNLKIAEGMKDAALVRKWAQKSAETAKRVIASPKDTETGHRRSSLAPQVVAYLEYLSFAEILQTPARAKRIELIEQFLKNSPKSAYVPYTQRLYLALWRETDPVKALSIAEKQIETDPNNEDALLLVAESYLQREKEPEKTLAYAEKVVSILEQPPKVEGMADAEWAKKKPNMIGRANWLIGSVSMHQNKYKEADKSIRAALPYIKSDPRLASMALFFLGWANYQMGNIQDAIRFNQDCTRIKGPFQEQALKNLGVIRSEHPEVQ